jgi:hypothetical protein
MVINGEVDAVEPVEAVLRGKPHVSIAILYYRIDVVGGKAVVTAEIHKIQVILLRVDQRIQQTQAGYQDNLSHNR